VFTCNANTWQEIPLPENKAGLTSQEEIPLPENKADTFPYIIGTEQGPFERSSGE